MFTEAIKQRLPKRLRRSLAMTRIAAKAVECFILKRADFVFPIRDSLGRNAIAAGARSDKVRVIPHEFDFRTLRRSDGTPIRQRFGIQDGQRVISFVGRLSIENYIDNVIEAVRSVVSRRRDIAVIIAGGGHEFDRIRAVVESDSVLRDVVYLPGFLSHDDACALRVIPDVSLCLMGGFSLIEARAAESVPIAYDVEWHHELVIPDKTGFLLPEGDAKGVADAVVRVLDDPATRLRLGRAARLRAEARHDIAQTTRIKRSCYHALLPCENGPIPRKAEGIAAKGRVQSTCRDSERRDFLTKIFPSRSAA